ncbi:hypothetical protein LguiA_024758 [Lonicera macranthoides]
MLFDREAIVCKVDKFYISSLNVPLFPSSHYAYDGQASLLGNDYKLQYILPPLLQVFEFFYNVPKQLRPLFSSSPLHFLHPPHYYQLRIVV